MGGDGYRAADPAVEEEADRPGGELLIPFKAAVTAARRGRRDDDVATYLEVSVPYARMRMNRSGARTIVAGARARRRRP